LSRQERNKEGDPGRLFAYFLATQKVRARERTSFKSKRQRINENIKR